MALMARERPLRGCVLFERMVHARGRVDLRITRVEYHSNTNLARLCRLIRSSRLDARKELLKLLRVSDTPDRNSFLAQQLPMLSSMDSDYTIVTEQTDPPLPRQVVFDYLQRYMLNSDITTSLGSCYAKSMPMQSPVQEALNARYQSAAKELGASQTERTPSQINYGVIFEDLFTERWSSEVEPNPNLARYYSREFRRWKEVSI